MTTIMGPTPCRDCKAPVSVVRPTFVQPILCGSGPALKPHYHDVPFAVLPLTVVDADGERHLCPVDTARYDAGSEEASSKRRHRQFQADAVRVEVLTPLPGPLRISE
jgi:hypothetical protein